MPDVVSKFALSPPARLLEVVFELVATHQAFGSWYRYQDFQQTAMAVRLERVALSFLRTNQQEEDGRCMAESRARDWCKYYIRKCRRIDDHWYPKDPVKRQEVDEWLDWSKALHATIEPVMVADVVAQPGSNRRQSGGFVFAAASSTCTQADRDELFRLVQEAERITSERKVLSVADLNLGDIATIMEITVVMAVIPGYDWDSYKNLKNVYSIMSTIPAFQRVHKPFEDFIDEQKKSIGTHPGYGYSGCPGHSFMSLTGCPGQIFWLSG